MHAAFKRTNQRDPQNAANYANDADNISISGASDLSYYSSTSDSTDDEWIAAIHS